MFLFDLFTDFTRPFRDACPRIEDSDDEMDDDAMSLVDGASDSSLYDVSEADVDTPISIPVFPDVVATLNTEPTYPPAPPPSPYGPPKFHDLSILAHDPVQISKRHFVRHHTRSSARHKAYSHPSLEQRQAYKRHSRRKKDMFVEDPYLLSPPVEPTTISPMADLVLPGVGAEVVATLANPVEVQLSSRFTAQCSVMESQHITVDSLLTPTLTPHDAPCATQKTRLTIKIPGLVDRLALRLLGLCSVTEQLEEDEEDVDGSSLGGYSASESSSEGDIDDDDDLASRSSLRGSHRGSRRRSRREAASPYHRVGGKSKRKELWADAETGAGGELPAFLLPPSSIARSSRVLRSGRVF